MHIQCVGSRMGNGGRTLKMARRHPAALHGHSARLVKNTSQVAGQRNDPQY